MGNRCTGHAYRASNLQPTTNNGQGLPYAYDPNGVLKAKSAIIHKYASTNSLLVHKPSRRLSVH